MDPPRAEKHKGRVLSPGEAKTLLETLQGTRLGAMVAVAVAMGLRIGECVGLRWDDVNIDDGKLSVTGQIQHQKGKGLVRVPPKSEASRRTLQMPEVVVKVLRQHRARQSEQRMSAGSKWEDHNLVFSGLKGRPLDPKDALHDLHKGLERAELPKLGWHDLRKSCASLLAAQGIPPATAMAILGHSTITLTIDTYTSVLPSVMEEAASKVGCIGIELTLSRLAVNLAVKSDSWSNDPGHRNCNLAEAHRNRTCRARPLSLPHRF